MDERYSLETAGFQPFWGIRLTGPAATWQIITPRNIRSIPRYILREATGKNATFIPLADLIDSVNMQP